MIGDWLGSFVGWWFGTNEVTPPSEIGPMCVPTFTVISDVYEYNQVNELSTVIVEDIFTVDTQGCSVT